MVPARIVWYLFNSDKVCCDPTQDHRARHGHDGNLLSASKPKLLRRIVGSVLRTVQKDVL